MPSNDIVSWLRVWSDWLNERCPDTEVRNDLREAADEIERLRVIIKTQADRMIQSLRDNDRTIHLCAARYHRLQAIRDLVVKHGVVDPLRHDILRQTDSLD